jgi:beta-mannosidase
MFQQSLCGDCQFRQAGSAEWLPARVPGGVHTDLLRLERIPDPVAADNEQRVQWVAETDWEYRRTFCTGGELLNAGCMKRTGSTTCATGTVSWFGRTSSSRAVSTRWTTKPSWQPCTLR